MSTASSQIQVPVDFAKPSGAYRMQAWLAMLGLVAFIALYVGLASYFSYIAYQMLAGVFAGGSGSVASFFASLPALFLAIFMWKALFFVRAGSEDPGIEIKEADEPGLFRFLYEIADEIGAPRPHRVFLSPDVNACVFYDLSILNFIVPSKKNLCIGLGLVNSLGRSEMKAVVAHEFGHFAQKTMAVGSWVYIGEQIAGHIIAKRDFLDRLLDIISAIDLRIAWIGWIMRLIVWSIRSLMESVFRLVLLAQRALSREMEFQADKVAISLAGSDALVHGLYRLQPADEDWQDTLDFANTQLNKGKRISNFYTVQQRIGEHLRRILNEPTRGLSPQVPVSNAAEHRVFTAQLAAPPRMWSTHPPNTQREENAKDVYLPARLDNDSAWTLFGDPDGLRKKMTDYLFEDVKLEKPPVQLSDDETVATLDENYTDVTYDSRYQGAYLGRPVTLCKANAAELVDELELSREKTSEVLGTLYPEGLHDQLTHWRNLNEEIAMLEAIDAGAFGGGGGMIHHRGNPVRRAKLPDVIQSVKQEREEAVHKLEMHDRLSRSTHRSAARFVAHGWQEYLECLTQLLHYAEHGEANLNDAHGHLAVTTNLAIASGRVSGGKLTRVMNSADDLHSVIAKLNLQAAGVKLPANIAKQLEAESWRDLFPKHDLPGPTRENIGEWLSVIDNYAAAFKQPLALLRRKTLGELLRAEQVVAMLYSGEAEPMQAPAPGELPKEYRTRCRGTERKRQTKHDWWTRFTIAEGVFPSLMRFGVAGTIVAGVVTAGTIVGNAKVIIYNGLSIPVTVHINDKQTTVLSNSYRNLDVGSKHSGTVKSQTQDGRVIESFDASMDHRFATYVYNIASAAPMVESTAAYGNARERPPNYLGAPRWRTTSANHVFSAPPRSVSTKGGGATRLVLNNPKQFSAMEALNLIQDESEMKRFVLAHCTWDGANSDDIDFYLRIARMWPEFDEIVDGRLAHSPSEVATLRVLQDTAEGEEKQRIEAAHIAVGEKYPDEPDYQYLAIRALPDGDQQDELFLSGQRRWPNHAWFSYAAGMIHSAKGDWKESESCFHAAMQKESPVRSPAAVEVVRIQRMLAGSTNVNTQRYGFSQALQYLVMLESGKELRGSPAYAYCMLDQGNLQGSYTTAGGENCSDDLKILIGASKDAKLQWQQTALTVSVDEQNDPALLFYQAAIAAKLNESPEQFLNKAEELYDGESASLPLIKQMIAAGPAMDPVAVRFQQGMYARDRGITYAVATILMGDRTPEDFRTKAKTLLFASERPSL